MMKYKGGGHLHCCHTHTQIINCIGKEENVDKNASKFILSDWHDSNALALMVHAN